MSDFSLVPVDHQPDFSDVSLVPVDHDPFSSDRTTRQVPIQQAWAQPGSSAQQPAMGVDQQIGVQFSEFADGSRAYSDASLAPSPNR